MRTIDVSKPEKLPRITALSYGASRTGKTRFAATWPRPLFLSDATESGWTTISNMDKSVWFETNRAPKVWAIEKVADMFQAAHEAEALVARGEVRTIVIDSLTFYADLYFNFAENAAGGRGDPRQLYQKLSSHLKTVREQIHLIGCNVVWLALAQDPNEERPIGGPMLSGQNAAKFAAGCDYVFYHHQFQPTPTAAQQWEIRTKRFKNYAAGGRDEGLLSDPLGYIAVDSTDPTKEMFVADSTYRTLAECLGIIAPVGVIEPVAVVPAAIEVPKTEANTNGKAVSAKPTSPGSPGRPSAPR